MSAKDLCINPNILTPILDGHQLKGGETLNIVGLVPADTNLLMESFFEAVVNSQPNEDEEENIGILYLTRSFRTAMRLEETVASVNQVARTTIIRTYNKFDGAEIMDLLADLEDDLVFRYVFIEDIDLVYTREVVEGMRKIRDSNQGHFLLTVSSGMDPQAHEVHEINQDVDDLLITASNMTYDKCRKLSMEVDVQIIALPDKAYFSDDTHIGQIDMRCIMSKRRGPDPYVKNRHTVQFHFGGY